MDINTENLKRFIEKIARNVVNDSSLQDIVTGVIKESLPGMYRVQLTEASSSALIEAVPFYEKQTYRVDDYVYLIGGKEDRGSKYITKYFIFGTVTDTQQNYANMSGFEKFQGNKIFFQYGEELNKDNTSFTCNVENGLDFINSIRAFGAFSLSAQVTSNYDKYVKYGLKIIINREDSISTEIEFLGDSYVGQPFVLTDSIQKKNIKIENYEKVISVEVKLILPTEDDVDNSSTKFTNISLESGTWLNLEEDFSVELEIVNNISYFKKNDNNGQVEIKAIAKSKDQILNTPLLKYYWFIEDSNNDSKVLFGLKGWKCINDSEPLQVINGNNEIEDDPYERLIYKADDNTIIFNVADAKNYKNNIKCVVTYNFINVKSSPVSIYNFDKESYNLEIKEYGENPIIKPEERITIVAELSEAVIGIEKVDYTYRWYSEDESGELTLLYYLDEKGKEVEYSNNNITFGYSGSGVNTEECFNIGEEPLIRVCCKAFFTYDGAIGEEIASSLDWPDDSNKNRIIEIRSRVFETDSLIEETFYSYNINTNSRPVFDKATIFYGEESSYIKYNGLTEIQNKINDDAFTWLKSDSVFDNVSNGKYYLFYSKQNRIRDIRINEYVRYEDFTFPVVLRNVEIKNGEVIDLLTDQGINQLNVFYSLTDNDSNDVFEFKEDENGKEKLYINATYIRSGTLEVRNNEGILFRASLEDKDKAVTIAGFKVDAFSIFSDFGNIGLYSGDKDNFSYFWVGGTKDNPVTKLLGDGSGFIGALNINSTGDIFVKDDENKDKFLISSVGKIELAGKITANSGSIGGFEIKDNVLYSDMNSYGIGLTGDKTKFQNGETSLLFWAGKNKDNNTTAPFRIMSDGSFYANKGELAGDLTVKSKIYVVDSQNDTIKISNEDYGIVVKHGDQKFTRLTASALQFEDSINKFVYNSSVTLNGEYLNIGVSKRVNVNEQPTPGTISIYANVNVSGYLNLSSNSFLNSIKTTSSGFTNGSGFMTYFNIGGLLVVSGVVVPNGNYITVTLPEGINFADSDEYSVTANANTTNKSLSGDNFKDYPFFVYSKTTNSFIITKSGALDSTCSIAFTCIGKAGI